MKKEWLMMLGVVAVTLLSAIGLIRWLAPQLLGIPVDLQTVQVNKAVVPFYENVFRLEDYQSNDFILKDPFTNVRAKPLFFSNSTLGPHDILGFRNTGVPNLADVVIIGDSQTYGNNVYLTDNWPHQLKRRLSNKNAMVYSMATGGWGAVQYLEMLRHATVFQPRVVVVAFYTGNDPHESLTMAYSRERWAPVRPDTDVDLNRHPPNVGFPPPESELWKVRFPDGLATTFSPSLRLVSNDTDYETVPAGYEIMHKAARMMTDIAGQADVKLVFTIIPTKELVYAKRIARDRIKPSEAYDKLVSMEKINIEKLAAGLRELPGGEYADVVSPLQSAAMRKTPLYPSNMNGHPVEAGYQVIAEAIFPTVERLLPDPLRGVAAIRQGKDSLQPIFIDKQGVWDFASQEVFTGNGWSFDNIRVVTLRDVAPLPTAGTIGSIDRRRFGPAAVNAR